MINEYLIVNSTEKYLTYTESVNGYYLLGVVYTYLADTSVFLISLKFSDDWLFFWIFIWNETSSSAWIFFFCFIVLRARISSFTSPNNFLLLFWRKRIIKFMLHICSRWRMDYSGYWSAWRGTGGWSAKFFWWVWGDQESAFKPWSPHRVCQGKL